MSDKHNYQIYNKEKTDDGKDLIITYCISFPNEEIHRKINFKDYRHYKVPTKSHMIEPDGCIFVCKETLNIEYYQDLLKKNHNRCRLHNKPRGCKFHLGKNHDDFKNRTQKVIYNCRCYCKPATQYEYDKWCYFDKINENKPLCDNGKIYKLLIS